MEVAFAIGRRSDPSQLNEALRSREKPSDRLPLAELAFEGHMYGAINSASGLFTHP